ncbi:hypothetical protein [Limosilactobacillus sp.]|uniref:hypothetical protein n=1 Tax=Limosilactobacillus sp. TaxID=2773925 RepID=UPI00345F0294
MKINELVEKINEHDGMRAKEVDKGIVIGTPNNMGIFSIPEDATNFIEIDTWATSNSLYWSKSNREYLSALIEKFLHTPVKERFPEKHYRVRLRGFNSDGGHQYLTVSTRYSTINLGSVFATVWNTGLKQTFTADELNKIRERFKGSKWIVSMLNDGVEEVGK